MMYFDGMLCSLRSFGSLLFLSQNKNENPELGSWEERMNTTVVKQEDDSGEPMRWCATLQ